MRSLGVLILLLLLSLTHAAYIYGDIYQQNLEKVNKTAIRIEGRFSYQLVTEKANYSIFLPEGEYQISASAFDQSGNPMLRAEENVNVGSEDQRLDLVLKPVFNLDFLPYVIAFGLIAGVFLWANRKWESKATGVSSESRKSEEKKEPSISVPQFELDDDANAVLRTLDSMEGRATQKEIKEALRFSDAKLSLILSELEQYGYIKKFKRGRANIVKKINPAS